MISASLIAMQLREPLFGPAHDPGACLVSYGLSDGPVSVALVNVDRLERVTLEFPSIALEEPLLEDLVRLILGRDSPFLKHARFAGPRGRPRG